MYNQATAIFEPIIYNYRINFNKIHARGDGINEDDLPTLISIYGKGTMELDLKPWYRVLVEEVINPYYVLQVFNMVIWFMNGYYRSGIFLRK